MVMARSIMTRYMIAPCRGVCGPFWPHHHLAANAWGLVPHAADRPAAGRQRSAGRR
jgi:hypothetical protein